MLKNNLAAIIKRPVEHITVLLQVQILPEREKDYQTAWNRVLADPNIA